MKKVLSLFLALLIVLSALPVTAELAESGETEVSEEQDKETRDLDEILDDEEEETSEWVPLGPTYEEDDKALYDENSPALYTCHIAANRSVFAERDITSEKLYRSGASGCTAELLYVGQDWCIARVGPKKIIGYTRRQYLSSVTQVDSKTTPPYGVQKSTYIATTAVTCHVRKSMSDEDESWVVLNPGTMLSIWKMQDGWAIVPYWRTFGYINMNELTDLIPVSPTDEPIRDDTPIAAYTSYYSMAQTTSNIGRINNIAVACRRLSGVMKSKATLDFNEDVGPYKKSNGYMEAPVLVNGKTQPGYGGGTCQVSSTLYNALLQLPGITILQRRPHGPSGAKYLPHGVDAAVGNSSLNFRFRNDYNFSIRLEGHSSNDGALLILVYKVSEE